MNDFPHADLEPISPIWLGQPSREWSCKRLKFCVSLINQKVDGTTIRGNYIGLENIESGTGCLITNSAPVSVDGISNTFQPGDILFGKLRPYLAKVLLAQTYGYCTSELLVIRPKILDPGFLFYWMLSPDFINIVDSSTYGAKMPRASWDFIGNLPQFIPPLAEQKLIVSFLDRKTAQIDALIAGFESRGENGRNGSLVRMCQLLREYRQTLISAAVTGKIAPGEASEQMGVRE